MKSNLIVILCFGSGICLGMTCGYQIADMIQSLPTYLLYALILQVGLNIGANGELGILIRNISPTTILLPLFTIAGTLIATTLASFLLADWSAPDCMAVGCGFGYYSLSSLLITQLKEPAVGIEIAAQLGAIALLANIIREVTALIGAPWFMKFFGKFAPVAAAGSPSMDVCLPTIMRYSGKGIVPIALIHGVVLDLSVPVLISFLCQ